MKGSACILSLLAVKVLAMPPRVPRPPPFDIDDDILNPASTTAAPPTNASPPMLPAIDWMTTLSLKGEQLPAGADGVQLPAGPDGVQLPAGADGVQLPAGPDGVQLPAGADGVQLPAGADGVQLPAGADGVQLPAGADGVLLPSGPDYVQLPGAGVQLPDGPGGALLPAGNAIGQFGAPCLDCKRWPVRVASATEVAYFVPFRLSSRFSEEEWVNIHWAMEIISRNTAVSFTPHAGEADLLEIVDEGGCKTSVGMQGGAQLLNLASTPGCAQNRHAVMHLLLHVLGLGHEHQRSDRAAVIHVEAANVCPGKASSFAVDERLLVGERATPYDIASTMHNRLDSYSCTDDEEGNKLETMIPVNPTYRNIINGKNLIPSSCDWAEVHALYPTAAFVAECKPGVPVDACDHTEFCEEAMPRDSCREYCLVNCVEGLKSSFNQENVFCTIKPEFEAHRPAESWKSA